MSFTDTIKVCFAKYADCLMLCWAMAALLVLTSSVASAAAPVLMISVDGLKPEYVLESEAHGLKIPYLRRRMAEGSYAQGVIGVWPTVTYPSHTSLVTGVTPAEHGILNNLEFDPEHEFKEAWYWYAPQIRVPTLWDSAHAAGLRTASVGWPVTVGNASIDYLIPEYWRTSGASSHLNPSDALLLASLTRPEGLLKQLATTAGPYMNGNDTLLQGDVVKTKYALDMIRRFKPGFMTVHLSSLDDAQHAHGVFSPAANEDLESIDSLISQLAEAAYASNPSAIVAIVSDHGFMNLAHWIHLNVAFRQAGLLEEGADPVTKLNQVIAWKAQPWLAGGMAAIMLHDPNDLATAHVVHELLETLAANPSNGIAAIEETDEIKRVGAFPGAAYLVVFKPGYYAGPNSTGDLITEVLTPHGGHGFSPEFQAMRSSFFIGGLGIARHRDLGIIDMRQIAPTLAELMQISLPSSHAAPLNVRQ